MALAIFAILFVSYCCLAAAALSILGIRRENDSPLKGLLYVVFGTSVSGFVFGVLLALQIIQG